MSDFATRMFEDPEGWWKERQAELERSYRADQEATKRQEQFWAELRRRNPDLKGQEELVHFVAAKNVKDLQGVTDANVMIDKIATLTRAEIDRITHRAGAVRRHSPELGLTGEQARQDADRTVMTGGPGHGAVWTESEPSEGGSLGDVIRDRRAARHEHATRGWRAKKEIDK